jgi:hypothetical protein
MGWNLVATVYALTNASRVPFSKRMLDGEIHRGSPYPVTLDPRQHVQLAIVSQRVGAACGPWTCTRALRRNSHRESRQAERGQPSSKSTVSLLLRERNVVRYRWRQWRLSFLSWIAQWRRVRLFRRQNGVPFIGHLIRWLWRFELGSWQTYTSCLLSCGRGLRKTPFLLPIEDKVHSSPVCRSVAPSSRPRRSVARGYSPTGLQRAPRRTRESSRQAGGWRRS